MEKLKELLGEELFGQVKEKLGDEDYFFAKGKDFIPKSRMDEINEQNKDFKEQLEARDKQLNKLSKEAEKGGELAEQIETLKRENEQTKSEYENKLVATKKENTLTNSLKDSGARNIKAVKALLDEESIKYEDDKLVGIEEQLKNIKEENPYLFSENKVQSKAGLEKEENIGGSLSDEWEKEFSKDSEDKDIFKD